MKEYRIKSSYVKLLWFMLFLSGVLLVFGISIPYLDGETYNRATIIVPAICTIIFIIPFIFIIKTFSSIPKLSIAIDDDGLWLSHLSKKDGLIYWENIASIKERTLMQCLELYDSNRNKIVRLEYQLEDFKTIRDIVIKKLSKNIKDSLPREFKKETLYKIINYVSCLLLIGFIVFLFMEMGILYGVLGFGFGCYLIYDLLFVSISKVIIDIDCLHIYSPASKRIIGFNQIMKISYESEKYKGNEIHFVSLKLKDRKKPFKLNGLNVEPNIILLSLKKYCK